MAAGTRAPSARGSLLLADISGYTQFLQLVAGAHGDEMAKSGQVPPAYPLVIGLLDGIVEQVAPPFTLSKVEGDAVFAFAADGDLDLDGRSILHCMESCYLAYRSNVSLAQKLMLCECRACSFIAHLDLKFVLHHGEYVMRSIAGHDELFGPDVTMTHLLLKNHVAEVIGQPGYALVTESAARHLEVPLERSVPHAEEYEHYPPIQTYVFALN